MRLNQMPRIIGFIISCNITFILVIEVNPDSKIRAVSTKTYRVILIECCLIYLILMAICQLLYNLST